MKHIKLMALQNKKLRFAGPYNNEHLLLLLYLMTEEASLLLGSLVACQVSK